ncbi:MAG: tRNA-dihydrouridine synthase [Candidatus Shapirobacteria bacterium]|nr:tRNA-dihydrouridine synthase [Candidatus Shapirobacteria bacterium]MDD3002975.1 tRNA-dihydrouridine synthase [Candidatus Shapirobacteria bacterium]MDD4383168.1 tRNA-dihydrouridine synthase [Candidatus Shapirobacteria bacterium]
MKNNSPIIGLAPMDGITDEAYRLLQTEIAKPDLIFTEFVSAEGISHGGVKLYDTLLFSAKERPIIGQLFGKNPESFYKSAIILSELGFDGVDINMGCPAKTVTQNGSGAALIGKPDLAVEIIQATKKGIDDWFSGKIKVTDLSLNQKSLAVIERNKKYSVFDFVETHHDASLTTKKQTSLPKTKPTISVKTRLGISESIIESWASILLAQDLDFLTIHGRTLKQGYAGSADWSEIQKVVELAKNTKTKIFGNGDIQSKFQGLEFCQKYGVNGVLIGRAACGNPWCFNDYTATPKERFSAMLLHAQFFTEIFPNRRFDSLRKNFLFYASGLSNAKQLRSKLVRLNSIEDLLQLEADFQS